LTESASIAYGMSKRPKENEAAEEVLIYRTEDGQVRMDVRSDGETVWLSQEQMAVLFDRERSVITKHIGNVFDEGELLKESNVQELHIAHSTKPIKLYSLDVIISVGYRVKSVRGTQFRIWATSVLREHLVRGYTIHRQRFERNARELEAALELVRKTAGSAALSNDQGRGLVDVIARYTQTFLLLQRYDEGLLSEPKGAAGGVLPQVTAARSAIIKLKRDLVARGQATDLLGRECESRALPACSATSTRASSASRPTRRSSPRPRTSCTSSSRTTPSPTATSASARSCSSSSCTATAACCGTDSPC